MKSSSFPLSNHSAVLQLTVAEMRHIWHKLGSLHYGFLLIYSTNVCEIQNLTQFKLHTMLCVLSMMQNARLKLDECCLWNLTFPPPHPVCSQVDAGEESQAGGTPHTHWGQQWGRRPAVGLTASSPPAASPVEPWSLQCAQWRRCSPDHTA